MALIKGYLLLNRREHVKRDPNAQVILRRRKKETGRKVIFAPLISYIAGQLLSFSYVVGKDLKRLNP